MKKTAAPARRLWRWGGLAALAVILALAFRAYTTPDMVLNWETLMALCGLA